MRPSRPTVLHLIQRLTLGGASRVLLNTARLSSRAGQHEHAVLSLLRATQGGRDAARLASLPLYEAPDADERLRLLAEADLVQVHFWNTPELYACLRQELPPTRVLLTLHVGGAHPPQVMTRALFEWADLVLATTPWSTELEVFRDVSSVERAERLATVFEIADFDRLHGAGPPRDPDHQGSVHRNRSFFQVGYVGTLGPYKLHPRFLELCAATRIPNVRFIVAGDPGWGARLERRAAEIGIRDRFDFRGYVGDVGSLLAELDVFGYPLCHDNYATADLALQEALAAGVPPVILRRGGNQALVEHEFNGLVVEDDSQYVAGLERLHRCPELRGRLGRAAACFAHKRLSPERAIDQVHELYGRLLARPARARRLDDVPRDASGATRFVASLDATADHFRISLESSDPGELLEAEARILDASAVLLNEGGGGLLHYRNAYPDDPMLRLWSALALFGQDQRVRALAELRSARSLGLDHWRIAWYEAQTTACLNRPDLARPALERVVEQAPDFEPARQRLATLGGGTAV